MNKESGDPDSRAGARSLQRPYFLSAECASSRRVFIHRTNFPVKLKKALCMYSMQRANNPRYHLFSCGSLRHSSHGL